MCAPLVQIQIVSKADIALRAAEELSRRAAEDKLLTDISKIEVPDKNGVTKDSESKSETTGGVPPNSSGASNTDKPSESLAAEAVESRSVTSAQTADPQPQKLRQSSPQVDPHESIVMEMVSRTKQEKDVCYFYLESADWSLENAIDLLQTMQGTAL